MLDHGAVKDGSTVSYCDLGQLAVFVAAPVTKLRTFCALLIAEEERAVDGITGARPGPVLSLSPRVGRRVVPASRAGGHNAARTPRYGPASAPLRARSIVRDWMKWLVSIARS
jgi:hypothetical protein